MKSWLTNSPPLSLLILKIEKPFSFSTLFRKILKYENVIVNVMIKMHFSLPIRSLAYHLARINSKELVKGIPCLKFENDRICGACQLGKQIKSSFKPIKDIMSTRPLELIHMDLFGPTKTKSLNGSRYAFV